jgi:hypothetical protein
MEREMFADPSPGDENDEDFMNELFAGYKAMGWKPEDLEELDARNAYAEWLKKN